MKPLCQTCTNIFNFPECCTEKLGESVGIRTHCGNYSGMIMQGETTKDPELEERFHIPVIWEHEPEEPLNIPEVNLRALCNNHIYEITRNLLLMIGDEEDKAYVKAVRQWAEEKGYDEVLLIDEEKLKTILKLGAAEYERLYKENMSGCMEG